MKFLALVFLCLASASVIIGQEYAVAAVKKVVAKLKLGQHRSGPVVLLFLGPPGCGKTLLAKHVARLRHGDSPDLESSYKYAFFSMASMKSEHDLYSFLSPPMGIVGEGSLPKIFQHEQAPVIVLDEIEKAHPVFISDMLLSLVDDSGSSVQDKKSHLRYDTSQAIFILTSNCFSEGMTESNITLALKRDWLQEYTANPACERLRRGDVFRRLAAGHVLAGVGHPYILFTPPSETHVPEIVATAIAESKVPWTAEATQLLVNKTREKFFWVSPFLSWFRAKPPMFRGGFSAIRTFVDLEIGEALEGVPTDSGASFTITNTPEGEFTPEQLEFHHDYWIDYVWTIAFVLIVGFIFYYFPVGSLALTMLSSPSISLGTSAALGAIAAYKYSWFPSLVNWGICILVFIYFLLNTRKPTV